MSILVNVLESWMWKLEFGLWMGVVALLVSIPAWNLYYRIKRQKRPDHMPHKTLLVVFFAAFILGAAFPISIT